MLEIVTDKERDLTAENEALRTKLQAIREWAENAYDTYDNWDKGYLAACDIALSLLNK